MLMYAAYQSNTPTILGRVRQGVSTQGISSLPGKMSRLAQKVWRQTTFQPYTVTRRFAGEELQLHITDIWAEDWYVDAGISSYEALWLKEHLHEGDLFVDCGAHHGVFSLLASRWVGETGKVLTLEPLPQNISTIQANFELNEVHNAHVVQTAVSSKSGEVYVEQEQYGFLKVSNGTIRESPHEGTISVRSATLDELLNGQVPSMLKIDVEGHEREVLKGATSTLAHLPALDIEIHAQLWDSPLEMINNLFDLLPLHRYQGMIEVHSPSNIEPFNIHIHTPNWIAACSKVNLYLTPLI